MAFTEADIEDLDEFLNNFQRTVPYITVARDAAFPGDIAIRHDVDHSIEKAHRFAHWEYEHSYKSTYFILTTAHYYDDPKLPSYLNDMISWGHEIGLHNDAMNAPGVDGDPIAAAGYIQHHKNKIENSLSKHYSLLGIADHGGAPHTNGDIWKDYSPQDLGFEYEAYQLQKTANTYISDNQGMWRSPLKHAQTFMLLHPTWWPV